MSHRIICAEDIVHQIERFLETALLLVYCRPETITVDDFHRLMTVGADGEFGLPLTVSPSFFSLYSPVDWAIIFARNKTTASCPVL